MTTFIDKVRISRFWHWEGSVLLPTISFDGTGSQNIIFFGGPYGVIKLVSEPGFDFQYFLLPETRSGHSYNIMDQGSTIPNPSNPNPNTNTSQASSSFQQQLDQFSQTLNMVMHRLDVIDECSNREVGRPPREARRVPRRREGIGDSGDENEEVQLGGVRHRAVPRQPRNTDVRRNVLDEFTRRMKVEVADFCGKLNPDAFFDWVTSLEDYFDWFSVPEERKVRFVKLKLKGPARAWWGSVEERLKRTRQALITEWEDMKERLEAKYLPINYEQLIYEDMLQWSQNNRATVDQYIERFHELTVRIKTNETEPQVLARYLKGLKPDIRKDMLTARLYNVEEAYQLALQLERQTSGNTRRFYSVDSGNFRFPTSTSAKPTVETTRGNVNGDVKGKERAFGEGPQCYKCKGCVPLEIKEWLMYVRRTWCSTMIKLIMTKAISKKKSILRKNDYKPLTYPFV
ncbi:hypothetical protein LWI29_004016 [Acer saccharum]|uniref:Retrotransposon gag domain-containing protein n=1 Tax=Acer saccharum TaxID=4024 RepID=A0AA39S146_ACESA|nr:hypothetical protein LWI29_004016 [Acer saccharum]